MGKKVDFANMKVVSEKDIKLATRRINAGQMKPRDFFNDNYEPKRLTKEQERKALKWLMNLWKTPVGRERKNNPFGYREENVLKNFKRMYIKDWYSPRGNYYYPYYLVDGGNSSFEYVVYGGKIHILG